MKLKSLTPDEFFAEFKAFLGTPAATNQKGIVYFWKAERPFPRVKGDSPILYIGQTSRSFSGRYNNSNSLRIERMYFENHYKRLIELHGPISIEIVECENPKLREWEELIKYNHSHYEYPPLNRSIPNGPNLECARS